MNQYLAKTHRQILPAKPLARRNRAHVRGQCFVTKNKHQRRSTGEETPARAPVITDVVQEASEDSFPASDPPNWATGQQRQTQDEEAESKPSKQKVSDR